LLVHCPPPQRPALWGGLPLLQMVDCCLLLIIGNPAREQQQGVARRGKLPPQFRMAFDNLPADPTLRWGNPLLTVACKLCSAGLFRIELSKPERKQCTTSRAP